MTLAQITVRLPEEARQALTEAAQASGRSLSSEIVHRLRVSLPDALPAPSHPAAHESAVAVASEAP